MFFFKQGIFLKKEINEDIEKFLFELKSLLELKTD